jgi:glutathione S-transferase
LNNKPEWYLKLNPLGQVPCLQHDDGRVLPESLIVCDYLDDIYPEHKLRPSDPYTRARHSLLLEIFSKILPLFYKVARNDDEAARKEIFDKLDYFETNLTEDFFGGNH